MTLYGRRGLRHLEKGRLIRQSVLDLVVLGLCQKLLALAGLLHRAHGWSKGLSLDAIII